jgi:hypothetical protein
MSDKKVYTALLPRKSSQAFINVFQSHGFNDALRPKDHPNKGRSNEHA